MYKALHMRDDIEIICIRKGERGLASIEDCVDVSI